VNFRGHLIGVVNDAQVTAVIGAPQWRDLPQGFAHWPADKRREFYDGLAAGYPLVKKNRARVRERIVNQREAPKSLPSGTPNPKTGRETNPLQRHIVEHDTKSTVSTHHNGERLAPTHG
jgi:hypothetical protein